MKTAKIILSFIVLLAFSGLHEATGQWATSGNNIYNTNIGNVGIGSSTPPTLLYVAKNMTEPAITVRNLGGTGGATFRMWDNASGADWKFKATLNGGFKIRDHASGLDVLVIEPNSFSNALYVKSGGNVGIGTSTPENSALVDMTSTSKGFLPPRMTQAQIEAIQNPADGLVVYCTTNGKLYIFSAFTDAYTEISIGPGILQPLFTCGTPITISHMVSTGVAPVDKTVTYGTVTNIPGEPTKCWITSNLGACQQAATVEDATEASAGWYWQFNEMQGYKHNGTAVTPPWPITYIYESSDWIPANDPCRLELGTDWRIPTSTEWNNVHDAGTWTTWVEPWNSGLKMHAAGNLNLSDGSLSVRGIQGKYWSSFQFTSTIGWGLSFCNHGCNVENDGHFYKSNGFTVRCISEPTPPPVPCGSDFTIDHMVSGGVAPVDKTVTYGTANNIPGEPSKCWITRNLGASQQATSVDDTTEASAGWYWQFNRMQGYKYGATVYPAWTITSINENSECWIPDYDPCRLELAGGWRLPTSTELTNIDAAGGWIDWNGPWNALQMHAAGWLDDIDGSLINRGEAGEYWSSTQTNDLLGYHLGFGNAGCNMYNTEKAKGFSIRCLRDF